MPPTKPESASLPVVLLTGASGYVGGLLPLLERQPVTVRCLARKPDKMRPVVGTCLRARAAPSRSAARRS